MFFVRHDINVTIRNQSLFLISFLRVLQLGDNNNANSNLFSFESIVS